MNWITYKEHIPWINYYLMLVPFIICTVLILRKHYQINDESTESETFIQNIRDGLTSSSFDLNQNENDLREGLNNTKLIKAIMVKYECNFDEARLIRQKEIMKQNNIDPETGLPLDVKAVY